MPGKSNPKARGLNKEEPQTWHAWAPWEDRGHPGSSIAWLWTPEKVLVWAAEHFPVSCELCVGSPQNCEAQCSHHGVSIFADLFDPYLLSGLNYNLTADVAQKEKGQLPRVYLVLLGETAGQVSEKLQLTHMEETCRHYMAHVKVSPLFFLILTLRSLQLVIWDEHELASFHYGGSDFHSSGSPCIFLPLKLKAVRHLLYLLFKNKCCCVVEGAHLPWCMCAGQRPSLWSPFSSCVVPRTELTSWGV